MLSKQVPDALALVRDVLFDAVSQIRSRYYFLPLRNLLRRHRRYHSNRHLHVDTASVEVFDE